MPTEHLPFSGFQVMQPATSEPENISLNSLAAYRIHDPDPILFTSSFRLQWIASSDNGHQNAGYCNYDYPVSSACPHPLAILESGVRSSDILTMPFALAGDRGPGFNSASPQQGQNICGCPRLRLRLGYSISTVEIVSCQV